MTKKILCVVAVSLFCANIALAQTARVPESIYKEGYEAVKKLFSQAVVAGDLAVCKELLEKNAFYVNEADANGMTQLHYAAMSGQTELCKLLLQHGAKADIAHKGEAKNYFTPLEAAIANDHTESALALINAVSLESLKPIRGWNRPPLFLAILNENVELIKALIAKKADVNTPGKVGELVHTPFVYAIAVGNKEIAKILLDAGADIRFKQGDIETSRAIIYAILNRNEDLCSFLIESKIDLNFRSEGRTILHVLLGDSILWETFRKKDSLQNSFQPFAVTGPYKTALSAFSPVGKNEKPTAPLFKRFVDAGADVNARDENGISVLETLLLTQSGAVNDDGDEVKVREYEDFQALLELLIAAKVDLNAADENGWTPLYYLMFYAFLDMQEYEEGLKEEDIKAIAEKKIDLFKMFIKAGAKVKVADKQGNTLLHYVVQPPGEMIEPFDISLDYDTRGNHRLFSRQLIELLIENGASLSDENKAGETPLDWATLGSRVSYGGMGGYGGGGYGGTTIPPPQPPMPSVPRTTESGSGGGMGGYGGAAGALGF